MTYRHDRVPFAAVIPLSFGMLTVWSVQALYPMLDLAWPPRKPYSMPPKKYLHDEDALGRWVEERCAIDPKYCTLGNELYENWRG